jgi:hypothetical protein
VVWFSCAWLGSSRRRRSPLGPDLTKEVHRKISSLGMARAIDNDFRRPVLVVDIWRIFTHSSQGLSPNAKLSNPNATAGLSDACSGRGWAGGTRVAIDDDSESNRKDQRDLRIRIKSLVCIRRVANCSLVGIPWSAPRTSPRFPLRTSYQDQFSV